MDIVDLSAMTFVKVYPPTNLSHACGWSYGCELITHSGDILSRVSQRSQATLSVRFFGGDLVHRLDRFNNNVDKTNIPA